jgi:flagellar hook-basal body complex protein FliE
MAITPISPAAISGVSPLGPEFQVSGVTQGANASSGTSFGSLLTGQLDSLNAMQQNAATQSQALATGQAADPSQVVMDVEQASLAMQLAVQVRNKAVDAYQELFRMTI